MRSLKRIGSAFAVLAMMLVLGGPAVADHGNDAATGKVNLFGFEQIDFSAKSSAAGTGAHGRARVTFTQSDPNEVLAGEVTCLRVVGATATTPAMASIGVLVTRNTFFGSTIQGLIIHTTDSGKFSDTPDTVALQFFAIPPPADGLCPLPLTGSPADGEVTIHNTP